jgi:hypothetical protein
MQRYIGIDVHRDSSTICVLTASGKRSRRDVLETRAPELVEYFRQLPGTAHVCIEETEWSEWLVEILSPHVERIVSVPGERPRGSKNDDIDAFGLAERLRTGQLRKAVYKNPKSFARLRELARVYAKLVGDVVRTKNRLRSLFRRRGVACEAAAIYGPETRRECIERLPVAMRTAVELLGLELDCLEPLRLEAQARRVGQSLADRLGRGLTELVEDVHDLALSAAEVAVWSVVLHAGSLSGKGRRGPVPVDVLRL